MVKKIDDRHDHEAGAVYTATAVGQNGGAQDTGGLQVSVMRESTGEAALSAEQRRNLSPHGEDVALLRRISGLA